MDGGGAVLAASTVVPAGAPPASAVVPVAWPVAGGITVVRSWVTRVAVAGAAGRVVGMTLKVAASPFLLIVGGDTLNTPAGVASAFSSLTSRGSVPRSSPPA